MNRDELSQRITEDIETIDDLYQRIRFESLAPNEQDLYLRHLQDQFDALPSYIQRYTDKQK